MRGAYTVWIDCNVIQKTTKGLGQGHDLTPPKSGYHRLACFAVFDFSRKGFLPASMKWRQSQLSGASLILLNAYRSLAVPLESSNVSNPILYAPRPVMLNGLSLFFLVPMRFPHSVGWRKYISAILCFSKKPTKFTPRPTIALLAAVRYVGSPTHTN